MRKKRESVGIADAPHPTEGAVKAVDNWQSTIDQYLDAIGVVLKQKDDIVSAIRPTIINALIEGSGIKPGDVIMLNGSVHEVRDGDYNVSAESRRASVELPGYQSDVRKSSPRIAVNGYLCIQGDTLYTVHWNTDKGMMPGTDNVSRARVATIDEVGYSLPTIAQVKGWIRKIFDTCVEENLGVRLDYRTANNGYFYKGCHGSDTKTERCGYLIIKAWPKYAYNRATGTHETETQLMASARAVDVCNKIKDYAERRGCVGEIKMESDATILRFDLVKKTRASKSKS